ncbi:MAG: Hint domain-containing protein [Rhodobacter sp.]|nr:Hint domain-containing protein [Rhodobacter sp.]
MPTTFDVFYLGVQPIMDTVEGDHFAENATALQGLTFGSSGDALANYIQAFSPGTTGWGGGDNADSYDHDFTTDTFSIDGGADQIYDMGMAYNATITYIDGTTAIVTAAIVQDTAGNTYWVPSQTYNANQAAMEAGAIRSLTLGTPIYGAGGEGYGLQPDRYASNYVTCFTPGTRIATLRGDTAVERIRPGDEVLTLDHGYQRVRWVGCRRLTEGMLAHAPQLCPVTLEMGAFGNARRMQVSPQHGLLVRTVRGERLIRAKHAAEVLGPEVAWVERGRRPVTYLHIMLDRHELVLAEGAPSESFYPGPLALRALGCGPLFELVSLFPDLIETWAQRRDPAESFGKPVRPYLTRRDLADALFVHRPA